MEKPIIIYPDAYTVEPSPHHMGCECGQHEGYGFFRELNTWKISPECPYHAYAAANPDSHAIPWNCPTFYDGCNCNNPDWYKD